MKRTSRRTFLLSILVGTAYLVVVLNAPNWIQGQLTLEVVPWDLLDAPWDTRLLFGSMFPGVFLLGAVPTYAYLEWGLKSPLLVAVGPFVVALLFEALGGPAGSDLVSPVGVYLLAWFIVLPCVLVAVAGERRFSGLRAGPG